MDIINKSSNTTIERVKQLKSRVIFLLFIFAFLVGCNTANEQPPPASEDQENRDQNNGEKEEKIENDADIEKPSNNKLTKEEVERLNKQFREKIIQEVDHNLKVKNFKNKEELVQMLSEIANKELVQEYVDLYYVEKDDQLYITPTDGPVTLNENSPYELKQNEKGKYYVSQKHTNELVGEYSFYMLFRKTANGWIIDDIKIDVKHAEEQDEVVPDNQLPQEDNDDQDNNENKQPVEEIIYSFTQIQQGGKLLLVNKTHSLPKSYVPEELVVPNVLFSFEEYLPKKQMHKDAASALEEMFEGAKAENIQIYAVSGYRSYKRQKQIFQYNVNQHGEHYANQFSARPGESEHQTGFTMDITARSVNFGLIQQFGETKEGKWVADNAYKYGFIIRYPEDKEVITGYIYEPWHLRYIGKDAAAFIKEKRITLEEYVAEYMPKG
jgi:LAS superfamily LD-carboxypeptidase LdcB